TAVQSQADLSLVARRAKWEAPDVKIKRQKKRRAWRGQYREMRIVDRAKGRTYFRRTIELLSKYGALASRPEIIRIRIQYNSFA
ncbi:MAG TPA: hypothetical protein DET40_14055, partial [Lentisphaeria bacterium]|nr:hypothetical protein [Lentisphaeria bacterium]